MFDDFLDVVGDVWETVADGADLVMEALTPGVTVIPGRNYDLVYEGSSKGIKCNTCGRTSWHPRDVQEKYCGYCHKFHETQN